MPFTGLTPVHDRANVVLARFRERRTAELRRAVVMTDVIAEFRDDVEGHRPRSLALRHLLNFMRMTPIEQRTFAYAVTPFTAYQVGRLRAARGAPPEIDETRTFASKAEAIVAAFELRLDEILNSHEPAGEEAR